MMVVDASALVDLLVNVDRGPRVQWHVARAESIAAPDLIHVETTSALWRMARAGEITVDTASAAVVRAGSSDLVDVPHRRLVAQAWRFREHSRITDAFYLACAEELHAPLLTTDARLARGHHGVPVTLVT